VLQAEKQTEVQIHITQTDLILTEFTVLTTEQQQTEITQKTDQQQTEVTILKELTQVEIIRLRQILLQELKIIHKELNQEDIQAKTDLIQTELLQLLNKHSLQEVILKTDQIQADQPLCLNRHSQQEAILKATDQVLTIIIHQEHKVLKTRNVLNLQELARNQEAASRKEEKADLTHQEAAEEEVNKFLFLNKKLKHNLTIVLFFIFLLLITANLF
jgi:hypothetical protein